VTTTINTFRIHLHTHRVQTAQTGRKWKVSRSAELTLLRYSGGGRDIFKSIHSPLWTRPQAKSVTCSKDLPVRQTIAIIESWTPHGEYNQSATIKVSCGDLQRLNDGMRDNDRPRAVSPVGVAILGGKWIIGYAPTHK
jgi:hypothetical protein